MKELNPLDAFDRSIFKIYEDHNILKDLWNAYKEKRPHLSHRDIIWNILTDYDDAFNTKKPYPYPESLYNALNKLVSIS